MAETNMPKHAQINMPKHGSGPPETFSEIKDAKTCLQTAFQKCLRQQDSKHAKSCQDTTCQHISRINKGIKHVSRPPESSTISYSNRSLRRQAVESKCRVRCQEVCKDSYTGQFCKRSSVAAPLASNLSVNSRR